MSGTLITVPMKDPARAKTRLAGELSPQARLRFVELIYTRTLDMLVPVAHQAGATLSVVTGSSRAATLARRFDVRVIEEPGELGLTAAVGHVAGFAVAEGFDRLCVIPADLAAPLAADVRMLLESDADVTICPSTDEGTNALLVAPPDAIAFQYGPHSARLHLQSARALGLCARMMDLDSLSFDIDTSACLTRAMRAVPQIAQACA
ncbi:MAG: 2-phospho-L-lactate guanylyltransferase [Pseudomonadota bacterium]